MVSVRRRRSSLRRRHPMIVSWAEADTLVVPLAVPRTTAHDTLRRETSTVAVGDSALLARRQAPSPPRLRWVPPAYLGTNCCGYDFFIGCTAFLGPIRYLFFAVWLYSSFWCVPVRPDSLEIRQLRISTDFHPSRDYSSQSSPGGHPRTLVPARGLPSGTVSQI